MTTFAVATLGCKVNSYESEGYIAALLKKGYQEVSFKEKADIYIINTCAVTNTATSKSRQKIHQAITKNEEAVIAVVGCYVQTSKEELQKEQQIDILVGSDGKKELPQLIEEALKHRTRKVIVPDVRQVKVFEALPIQNFTKQTRAFLKIQDGCNQFCSYCIIPYARGAERSLSGDEVVKIAKNLVNNGHLEIVLSGIHTGRYQDETGLNLTGLMKRLIREVEGLERIRISSIEMNEISDELLAFMKEEPKIARHLHIPIQSANNEVLQHMNRPYNVEWFIERVAYIRSLLPMISISTDVIVGFPMESEEQFHETLHNIEKMQLSFCHVFPFSKRDRTVAATMKQQLSNIEKKKRANQLIQQSKKQYDAYKKQFIGKTVNVIFEHEKDGYLFGHSSEYLPVLAKLPTTYLHKSKDVVIQEFDGECLVA